MATTDDIVQRLCAALRADSTASLVELLPDLQAQRVEVAARTATLGEAGRKDLRRLLRYVEDVRKSELGTLRIRHRGRLVAGQVRPWTSPSIEELRGRLLGLLPGGKSKPEPMHSTDKGYVSATSLVRQGTTGRHNTKVVRRFAERNNIPMRREGQRRYIDGEAFNKAWQERDRATWQRIDEIDAAKRQANQEKQAPPRR